MAEDHIRYDILAQEALRGVMRKVLAEVARTGLPGSHHFFITFLTGAPGVRISSRLRERYPEQMTIVVQSEDAAPAAEQAPPPKLEAAPGAGAKKTEPKKKAAEAVKDAAAAEAGPAKGADVVSLDSFRK